MNKILTKVTALCVGLAMVAGVGVAVGSKKASEAKAEASLEQSYDLSSSVPSGLTASTTLSVDSNNRGMGKGGTDYTLTTSTSFENVVKVVVNAATNYSSYSSHKISVSVGGSSFDSEKGFSAKASTDYTFESSQANGVVVVSFNNAADGTTKSNTIWCKTIEIWTEAGSSATLENLSISGSMSKTAYYVGEAWNPSGFSVIANYDDDSHPDVTSSVTWTYSPASPALNVTSVVATATFGGKSVSSSAQTVSVSKTNPIQVIYTKTSGSVDVYGYYVGFLDGTGPVIMDGDYGIVVYNKSADVSGYTVNETILHVTGSISIYNGLYEIGSATISVASGTYDAPATPVVYATAGGETAEYASRLTTVTGTPTVTKGSFDDAAGSADITMTFAIGTKSVQVFYKKAAQTADADAFAAVKDAVANSTEITIKGFTGWYNGFQVQMNGYIPAAVDYTAEDFAQDLLDQTDGVCAGYEEGDNNHDALVAIWSDLASNDKYPSLPSDQKTILAEAERDESGTVVEQAMARYDFLTGKYSLSNFINGRTPIVVAGSYVSSYENNLSSSSSITIIVIVAVASMTLLGVTLVIRKRKMN